MGSYFAQVAEVLCQEDQPNPELLSLVLNSLYALSKLDVSELLLKAAFELRCACLAGYTPDLNGCSQCGNSLPDRFNVTTGQLECSSCRDNASDSIRMPITPGVLDSLRYICFCDPKLVFSFSASGSTIRTLSQITELYLTTQLERGFSALDFYKTILLG
jgi:DNA repair protein RecO (recombination protein O)